MPNRVGDLDARERIGAADAHARQPLELLGEAGEPLVPPASRISEIASEPGWPW